jgi:hypothetical protein
MVYEAQDLRSGKVVHLHINAASVYSPVSAKNGWSGTSYGSINLKAGTSVDLRISVRDPLSTNIHSPIGLPELAFTFAGLGMESADGAGQEFVIAEGYTRALLEPSTTTITNNTANGRTIFHARTQNPSYGIRQDPMRMTQQQKDHSVVLFYNDVQELNITIGSSFGRKPHSFSFAAFPALLCAATAGGPGGGGAASAPAPRRGRGNSSRRSVLPPLPLVPGGLAIKQVIDGSTFQKWFAVKGDFVHAGSPVALTKRANGMMDFVTSVRNGTLVAVQPLQPGERIRNRVQDSVIAVIANGSVQLGHGSVQLDNGSDQHENGSLQHDNGSVQHDVFTVVQNKTSVGFAPQRPQRHRHRHIDQIQIPMASWWFLTICLLGSCGLSWCLMRHAAQENGGRYTPVGAFSLVERKCWLFRKPLHSAEPEQPTTSHQVPNRLHCNSTLLM